MTPAQLRLIFERLKLVLPDTRIECRRWATRGDVLFAETAISATLGEHKLGWSTIDLFELRGDRACEQLVYFDESGLRAFVEPQRFLEGLDLGQG